MTTYVVDTAGGGDYASLNAAEAALNANLTTGGTADTNFIIECQGGEDSTAVDFNGWTTDATHTITIRGSAAADGKNNGSTFSTSYYYGHNVAAAAGNRWLRPVEDYMVIDGLQILNSATANNNSCIDIFATTTTTNLIIIKNCRFKNDSASGNIKGIVNLDADTNLRVYNCTFEWASVALNDMVLMTTAPASAEFYNCVFEGGASGIRGGSATVKNCVFINNTDDVIPGTSYTITYCAGDDADFDSGTGNIGLSDTSTDWDAIVTDYTTGDYTLTSSGSPSLRDAGDATNALTTDINGVSWGTMDIGAFAFDSGGGASFQAAWARRATTTLFPGARLA